MIKQTESKKVRFRVGFWGISSLVVVMAMSLGSVAADVDYERLPSVDLQSALVHDGWSQASATDMYQSILRETSAVRMPADLLFGALEQESSFKSYGVNYDFGNYSCGIAQSNISVWCAVASASRDSIRQYNWPQQINCEDLQDNNAAIMAPLLNAAKQLRPLTVQGALASDFQKLDPQTMIAQMPGSDDKKQAYYQAAMSFVNNCSKSEEGLKIATTQLRLIYDQYVPDAVKSKYPHTSWVMADAMYNIGPVLTSILEQAGGGTQVYNDFTPQKMIDLESTYLAAGHAGSDTVTFQTEDGPMKVSYFQICVNQRHIQNVMRDTLPTSMKSIINASTENCKK